MGVQNDLLNELRGLLRQVNVTAQVPVSGSFSKIAAEPVSALSVVMATADGRCMQALSARSGWQWPIGITKQAGGVGVMVDLVGSGDEIEDPSWSWDPGQAVWIDDAARLTQEDPGGEYLVVMGVALSPTRILVRIEQPVKLA